MSSQIMILWVPQSAFGCKSCFDVCTLIYFLLPVTKHQVQGRDDVIARQHLKVVENF